MKQVVYFGAFLLILVQLGCVLDVMIWVHTGRGPHPALSIAAIIALAVAQGYCVWWSTKDHDL